MPKLEATVATTTVTEVDSTTAVVPNETETKSATPPAKSNGKRGKAGSKIAPKPELPVVYEKIAAKLCVGEKAITVKDAKKLLGWEEVEDGDYHFTNLAGRRIRCRNSAANRPFYFATTILPLKQEILRKRWRFNGESIIVSRSGMIHNGNHTLAALVLAGEEWDTCQDWREYWESEPTLEKLLVLGISDDDDTVNTIDTAKPRTLTDVLYRAGYFANVPANRRKVLARMADYAIRLVWSRTGAGEDAYSVKRTHSESIDFLNRHMRLIDCVRHIEEENGTEGRLVPYLPPGTASGLLYLMVSSASDSDTYTAASPRREDVLQWSFWDRAFEFFVLLAGKASELSAVHEAIAAMSAEGTITTEARLATVIKGWLRYAERLPIRPEDVKLDWVIGENGVRSLTEVATVGGIDGVSKVATDPSPQEIEAAKAEIKSENGKNGHKKPNGKKPTESVAAPESKPATPKVEPKPATPVPTKTNGVKPVKQKIVNGLPIGGIVYVSDESGKWHGRLVSIEGKQAKIKVEPGNAGAGTTRQVHVSHVKTTQG